MKSFKRGRAPSLMGGVISIATGLFGLLWTVFAYKISGSILFSLFGIIFIIIAVVQAIYNFRNATSENRYSEFDITDSSEESDPLNEKYGTPQYERTDSTGNNASFCPYCGMKVEKDYEFCRNCGRKLPD